jgi:hypothetical protein
MGYRKEISVGCSKCGVLWNEDFSNKTPKRALCKVCMKVEYEERKEKYNKAKFKRGENRHQKYKPFKIENRKHIHKAVNLELRALKDRTQIREFLRKRFDELLKDTALWDYINDTDIQNKTK